MSHTPDPGNPSSVKNRSIAQASSSDNRPRMPGNPNESIMVNRRPYVMHHRFQDSQETCSGIQENPFRVDYAMQHVAGGEQLAGTRPGFRPYGYRLASLYG